MKYLSSICVILVFSLTACGGGGGSGTTAATPSSNNGAGSVTPCNGGAVTYTTAEGMPIFVDFRLSGISPKLVLNLGCGEKIEVQFSFDLSEVIWKKNDGEAIISTTTGASGDSVSFADGYILLINGITRKSRDITITTPKGETLQFRYIYGGSILTYDSGPSKQNHTTFEAYSANIRLDIKPIRVTVNGGATVMFRAPVAGYITNETDIFTDIRVGYSSTKGDRWGFDPNPR